MRYVWRYAWRLALAGVVLTAISMGSYMLLSSYQHRLKPERPFGEMAPWLLLSAYVTAAALAYPTVRSRWSGTQLIVAVFVAMFGLGTFTNIAQGWLLTPKLIDFERAALWSAHGFLTSVAFSFALVLIMGRLQPPGLMAESSRLHLPPMEWLWKLAVCVVVSVGMLVLIRRWCTPASVAAFLAESGLAPMWQAAVFQVGRALLLIAFVLPVIKMTKGGRLECAVMVGVLMAVLCTVSIHILPGSTRHDATRYFRLVSGTVTHLLYGLLVGYLFGRRPTAV